MKTIIISSSLSENSKSYKLCQYVADKLETAGAEVNLIEGSKLELKPFYQGPTKDMEKLIPQVAEADNIIFSMAVYNYSLNDSLKIILDSCIGKGGVGKFFGILCSAGGDKSYLATQHLTQICQNEWRMIQLPRVVYANTKKDFIDKKIISKDLAKRLDLFSKEFKIIGEKLLA